MRGVPKALAKASSKGLRVGRLDLPASAFWPVLTSSSELRLARRGVPSCSEELSVALPPGAFADATAPVPYQPLAPPNDGAGVVGGKG